MPYLGNKKEGISYNMRLDHWVGPSSRFMGQSWWQDTEILKNRYYEITGGFELKTIMGFQSVQS